MKRILIYRHPDCEKCARFARVHHAFDWFNRIADTTAVPATGPLRKGQIVVEDLRTHRFYFGADTVAQIARQILLYWPVLGLLRVPAIRTLVDRDVRGCADDCGTVAPRPHLRTLGQ
jgi:hypothetical protein